MAPLILHNVPDDELYVGDDGVKRPYAVVFPGTDGTTSARLRKQTAETGSFGKSTRRSRSKTGTPAKKEDPTLLAADAVFTKFLAKHSPAPAEGQLRGSGLTPSASQPNLLPQSSNISTNEVPSSIRHIHQVPAEVVLRGFSSTQQYAAIHHFENLAGRICEDYPRDAPMDQRRFKGDLRDPVSIRSRTLTPEEQAKARRYAGGDHWIKVTFESVEAAEAAIYSSPQLILGHQVYAEPYQGQPPTVQDEVFSGTSAPFQSPRQNRFTSQIIDSSTTFQPINEKRPSSTLPRSFTTPSMTQLGRSISNALSLSPPGSNTSSNTLDTGTISTATFDTATLTSLSQRTSKQPSSQTDSANGEFCRLIPTARRAALLPAEEALLPQQSWGRRMMSKVPFISTFSADLIGVQVPRTELGEFDWGAASIWWRAWWLMDYWFGLSGGDLAGALDKDE